MNLGVLLRNFRHITFVITFPEHAMGTDHPHQTVHFFILRANHAAFNRAHMMCIVKRKIGNVPEGTTFFPSKDRPVGLAGIFNQGNIFVFAYINDFVRQTVIS